MEISEETSENLVIKNISYSKSGNYKCNGENIYGVESIEFFVSLKEPAKIMKAEEVNLKQGDFVSISCVVKGRPLPNIIWTDERSVLASSLNSNMRARFDRSPLSSIYFNEYGQEVSYSDTEDLVKSKFNFFSKLTNINENTLKLDMTFKKKYIDGLGTLKCSAENDKGAEEKELVKKFIRFNDRVGSKLSYNAVLEESLILECNIIGNPKPKITWKFVSKFFCASGILSLVFIYDRMANSLKITLGNSNGRTTEDNFRS